MMPNMSGLFGLLLTLTLTMLSEEPKSPRRTDLPKVPERAPMSSLPKVRFFIINLRILLSNISFRYIYQDPVIESRIDPCYQWTSPLL